MSDFAAGSGGGAQQGEIGVRSGGSPPPVLLAALGVAVVIAVLFVVVFSAGGNGTDNVAHGPSPGAAAAAPLPRDIDDVERVRLIVAFEGDGSGTVRIWPRGDECDAPCKHSFATGTRVTVTAEPASGSTFDGWGDSCGGAERCTFVMNKRRALTVIFGERPSLVPDSGADDACIEDPTGPGCTDSLDADSLDADSLSLDEFSGAGTPECVDGKDNDGDGLIDNAQDPGCEVDNTEAG